MELTICNIWCLIYDMKYICKSYTKPQVQEYILQNQFFSTKLVSIFR